MEGYKCDLCREWKNGRPRGYLSENKHPEIVIEEVSTHATYCPMCFNWLMGVTDAVSKAIGGGHHILLKDPKTSR